MSKKLAEFFEKHKIEDWLAIEIQNLFINILLENSTINIDDFRKKAKQEQYVHELPRVVAPAAKDNKKASSSKSVEIENKKWASKTAQQFAEENNVSLDDFSKSKVTKMDIVEFLKANKKVSTKKIIQNKCNGITKKGDECNKPGTHKPDESSHHYCFKHFENWKVFEEEGNSTDEEDTNMNDINFDPTNELVNGLGKVKIEQEQTELNLVDTDDEEDPDEANLF